MQKNILYLVIIAVYPLFLLSCMAMFAIHTRRIFSLCQVKNINKVLIYLTLFILSIPTSLALEFLTFKMFSFGVEQICKPDMRFLIKP